MLLWVYRHFVHQVSGLNVLRYVSFRTMVALGVSFLVTMLLYPWFIDQLRRRGVGQPIRDDGPQSHFSKEGTPTMGGVLLVVSVVVASLVCGDLGNPYVWMTLGAMVGLAVLGFRDDYVKATQHNPKGVSARTKLIWQFAVALAVMGLLLWGLHDGPTRGYSLRLYVPFLRTDIHYLELPAWAYAAFGSIVIVGAANGVNLTDGLDGLAIGPAIVASFTFLILCYLADLKLESFDAARYLHIPKIPGVQELTPVCAAMAGAGVGFLWYNTFPAQVFMGDVGALAIGGALGCIAVFTKNELLSVIILGVFVLESISVIAQTTSYKLTGKRVFRMAPIHHHFELKGWPEAKITVRFWIVSMVLSVVALASLKLR